MPAATSNNLIVAPGARGILVVEDDADVASSIADLMRDAHYSCDVVANGRLALERIIRGPRPAAVVLDLKLPETSGREILEVMRRTPGLSRIPVIVVSAFLGKEPEGAVACLRKPVKPADLLDLVGRHAGPAPREGSSWNQGDATLLRYRFDSQAQLERHLHVIEARALLYYRDPKIDVRAGARVLVEVMLADVGQQSVLRGRVLGRDEGRGEGLWLEFPDTRLARRVGGLPIASRRQRRLPTDMLVELRAPPRGQLCRMTDLSLSGARLEGFAAPPSSDGEIELRLVSTVPGLPEVALCRARIVRAAATEAAVRFVREHESTRQIVVKLLAAIEQSWAHARELTHPPMCCGPHGVLDPPLPRFARRS